MPASSAQRLHILRSRFTKQEMFIPNCVAVYKRILPRSVHNLTIFFPPFRFHANTQNWNWFRSVCCCCLSLSCFFFVAVSLFSVCTYQIWIIFISLCMFIPYMKISIELKRAAKRWKHVTSYTYVECEEVSFFFRRTGSVLRSYIDCNKAKTFKIVINDNVRAPPIIRHAYQALSWWICAKNVFRS